MKHSIRAETQIEKKKVKQNLFSFSWQCGKVNFVIPPQTAYIIWKFKDHESICYKEEHTNQASYIDQDNLLVYCIHGQDRVAQSMFSRSMADYLNDPN